MVKVFIIILSLSIYLNASNIANDSPKEAWGKDAYHLPLSIKSHLTLGYENFIALIKWFQFISYFGGSDQHKLNAVSMLQQLKEVTTLNPNHQPSYYVAATILPWLAKTSKLSNPLLEQAMQQFPQDWRWPFYAGFNTYWFDHDKKKAAYYLKQASTLKGAPPIVMQLALRMQADTGQFDTALMFLNRQINTATDKTVQKQLMQQRIKILTEKTLFNTELLLKKLPVYQRNQEGIQKLIESGYHIPNVLPDGGHILFKKDGSLLSSKSKKRFKLFIPHKRQGVVQHESTH